MTQFFINNEQNEVQVNIAPQITTTEDETLDSASVILKANDNPNPIAPMQLFIIKFDDGQKLLFYVVSDQVSVYSENPLTYQHKLTITQNTRKLSKHLMRNTVFTQPPAVEKRGYTSTPICLYYKNGLVEYPFDSVPKLHKYNDYLGTKQDSSWTESIVIRPNEKVGKVWFKIQTITFNSITQSGSDFECQRKVYDNPYKVIKASDLNGFKFTVRKNELAYQDIIITDPNINLTQKTYSKELTDFFRIYGVGETKIIIESNDLDYVKPLETYPEKFEDLPSDNPFFITVQIEIGVETYYYSAYDVLKIINQQYIQETADYKKDDLFLLPESGKLYDLLNNTIVPNMTFTQSTYFEAVSEVFKLFDAVFTIDENKMLGIEFLNETAREIINANFIGRTTGIGEEKYNNGLISFYQNALLEENYPSNNEHIIGYAPARSPVLGVPSKEDWYILLPHKIDTISRVYVNTSIFNLECFYNNPKQFKIGCLYYATDLEITPFVIESSIWSLLNTSDTFNPNFKEPMQKTSIAYTRGTNQINLSSFYKGLFGMEFVSLWNVIELASKRYFGFDTYLNSWGGMREVYNFNNPVQRAWDDVGMSVQYIAQLDGKLKVESNTNKYEGEMLMNQASGGVDLNKLGLNMLGLSYKLGEPMLSANQESATWDTVIKKGQVYTDEQGDQWVANVCTYTIYNDFIQTNIQFVKNFNGLSQYIKVDRQKRLTTISREMAVKCEDIYTEYLYISGVKISLPQNYIIALNRRFRGQRITGPKRLIQEICATFGFDKSYIIDYATMEIIFEDNESTEPDANVFLPLIKYGSGNAICFEMSMDDSISAGPQTKISSGWFGENKYFTKIVPYADNNGFFYTCNISLNTNRGTFAFGNNFPDMTAKWIEPCGLIKNFNYCKKSNEIFALNYELICLVPQDRIHKDFIGQKFITENGLVKGKNPNDFYIYFAPIGFKYSILNTKCVGDKFKIQEIIPEAYADTMQIEFVHGQPENDRAWAIGDYDGNLYFASNEPQAEVDRAIIYFNTSHDRL